jgi:hypothetical protein
VATNAIAATSKGDRGKYNKQAKSFHKSRIISICAPQRALFSPRSPLFVGKAVETQLYIMAAKALLFCGQRYGLYPNVVFAKRIIVKCKKKNKGRVF